MKRPFKKVKRPEGVPGFKKFRNDFRDMFLYEFSSKTGIPLELLASAPVELERLKRFSKSKVHKWSAAAESIKAFGEVEKTRPRCGFSFNGEIFIPIERDKNLGGFNGISSASEFVEAKEVSGPLREMGLI
jgi:hypothetical protein